MKNYNYGMIGNCTIAALINSDTAIEWLCLPFFDSPSLFARILDEEKGGFFRIKGVDTISIKQSYVYHTAILKTVIETKSGAFELYDFMPRFIASSGEVYCPSEIHRDIRVTSGSPQIVIELSPKPNYALSDAK